MAQVRVSWIELVTPDPAPFGKGYPPGSVAALFPSFPYLGPPASLSGGDASGPAGAAPLTPCLTRWVGPPDRQLHAAAPPGTAPEFASPVLAQATRVLDRWRRTTRPDIPGIADGPWTINPGRGNLVLTLAPPAEGPTAPAVALVYNSQSVENPLPPAKPNPADMSAVGWGWTVYPKHTLTSLTSTAVDVAYGDGTVLRYNDLDGTGAYRGPGGTADALQLNGDGTWTQTANDGSVIHFGVCGPADYLASPAGNRWTLTYSGRDLETVTDPYGYVTTLTYDGGSGLLQQIEQPSGRITTVDIDGSTRDLVGITWPDDSGATLEYDSEHRLTAYTDPRMQPTQFTYKVDCDGGHVSSVTLPTGDRTCFAYYTDDPPNYRTRILDAAGQVTTLQYTPYGNLGTLINPLSQRTTYTWHRHALTGFQNARGYSTTFDYAPLPGRANGLAAIADARGGVYAFQYDGDGRVTSLVDQLGYPSTLTWSGPGLRTQVTDPTVANTEYAYNAAGQVTQVTDPTTRPWATEYDDRGSIAVTVDPVGARTTLSYDAARQVVGILDPLNRLSTVVRDPMNRPTTRTNPLDQSTLYAYDPAGNPVSRTDPLGRRWTTVYDQDSRVLVTVDPLGARTTNTYTPTGQIGAVADPSTGRTRPCTTRPAGRS
ncbi:hypothetical protein [Fimbriiglobus ruber]|uniref:Rhs-family protein n=1 Tax=Fimbriiglobus ruber TaxID=1908690 RepID=A0A225D954_9BACT|nr:hypothetical protein [Fimbriiglobus ruber]OWK38130.1 Rhs-family protein [Fimbriiglobus ruber]